MEGLRSSLGQPQAVLSDSNEANPVCLCCAVLCCLLPEQCKAASSRPRCSARAAEQEEQPGPSSPQPHGAPRLRPAAAAPPQVRAGPAPAPRPGRSPEAPRPLGGAMAAAGPLLLLGLLLPLFPAAAALRLLLGSAAPPFSCSQPVSAGGTGHGPGGTRGEEPGREGRGGELGCP